MRFASALLAASLLSIGHSEERVAYGSEAPSAVGGFDERSWRDIPDLKLEGYIQAQLDIMYYEAEVLVRVRGSEVFLYNIPENKLIEESITSFVKDMPRVKKVTIVRGRKKTDAVPGYESLRKSGRISGVWFPQSTVLFAPIISNPRQVTYSLGMRFADSVMGNPSAVVSFGDDFPIYRWQNVGKSMGDVQISIEAGVWCVFSYEDKNGAVTSDQFAELINSDFYAGIPITYAINEWAFRWRLYHISSHLGDEFLVNHQDEIPTRKNPSKEVLDFLASYQLTSSIRLFGGPGYVLHSDKTYPLKRWHFMYGMECRFMSFRSHTHGLYGQPFLSMWFENDEQHNWEFNNTYVVGYEWSKLQGVGRKVRVFFEYHHGFSMEGQFSNRPVEYGAIAFSYGF